MNYKAQCPYCQASMIASGDSFEAMKAMPSFNENAFVSHCNEKHNVARDVMRKWFRERKASGIPSL